VSNGENKPAKRSCGGSFKRLRGSAGIELLGTRDGVAERCVLRVIGHRKGVEDVAMPMQRHPSKIALDYIVTHAEDHMHAAGLAVSAASQAKGRKTMIATTWSDFWRSVGITSVLTCSLALGLTVGARAQDTVVLNFATLDSPDSIIGRGQDWYLKRVEELSNGRITFERHWSSSLVPPRQLLEALTTGVADVSFIISQFTPDKLPLLTVQTLPTNHEDLWIAGMAMDEFAGKPYVEDELAKQNAVYLVSMAFPTFNLLLKKPVNSVDDLAGLKIWASGEQATLVQALGAVPVTIPTPEVYTALERGTVDGAAYPPLLMVDFGMHEAASYLWKLPLGLKSSLLAINRDVWNSLPPDLQEIMRSAAADTLEYGAGYHEIVQEQGNKHEAMAKMNEAGVTVTEASDSDKAKVNSLVEPLWEAWAKKMDEAGLPGTQAAADFRGLLDKYAAELPNP
jgi:TRAP-type transport system periplasmic protein